MVLEEDLWFAFGAVDGGFELSPAVIKIQLFFFANDIVRELGPAELRELQGIAEIDVDGGIGQPLDLVEVLIWEAAKQSLLLLV